MEIRVLAVATMNFLLTVCMANGKARERDGTVRDEVGYISCLSSPLPAPAESGGDSPIGLPIDGTCTKSVPK